MFTISKLARCFPVTLSILIMLHKFHTSPCRDNFVEVQIYYQDLVTVEESQSPAYTMTQLWSKSSSQYFIQ